MVHSSHILFDDRPFVEICCHVMGRCPNDFDASCEGLVIGSSAFEAWLKRVVNVDDRAGRLLAEVVGENLHVSGEYCEINAAFGHD